MTDLDRKIQSMLRERAEDIQVLPPGIAGFDRGVETAGSRTSNRSEGPRQAGWLVAAAVIAVIAVAAAVIAIRANHHAVPPTTHTPTPTAPSVPFSITYSRAGVELNDISCAAADDCVAVGVDAQAHRVGYSFDGRAWTQAFTVTGGGGVLVDSCAASGSCMAVDSTGGRWRPTATSPWQQVTLPDTNRVRSLEFNDISCVSARSCLAVGTYDTATGSSSPRSPIAYRWNGLNWAQLPSPPVPANRDLVLPEVSCWAADRCRVTTTDLTSSALLDWNGTSWSTEPLPSSTRFSLLIGLSCTSLTSCVVVGAVPGRGWGTDVLDGSTWTWQPFASSTTDAQGSVSCTAANACVYLTNNTDGTPNVETWNGRTWALGSGAEALFPNPTSPTAPLPPGRSYGPVSCVATGQCFFTGYEYGSQGSTGFIESSPRGA